MPKNEDDIFDKIFKEQEGIDNAINQQMKLVDSLPEEEQVAQIQKLRNIRSRASSNLKARMKLAGQGLEVESDDEAGEPGQGALGFILESLGKPLSAAAFGVRSLIADDEEKEKEYRSKAIKSAIPFFETVTGEDVPYSGFAEVLEDAGMGEGGKLSEVFPSFFTDDGEGALTFKRGGVADITGRGAAGLGLDLVLDPLNLLFAPVKGASLAGRLASKTAKGTGKAFEKVFKTTAHAAMYESKIINPLLRLTNRYKFLARGSELSTDTATAIKKLDEGLRNLNPKVTRLLESPEFGDFHNFIREYSRKDEFWSKAATLDDVTTAAKAGDMETVNKFFPQWKNFIDEAFDGNKFNPEKFREVFFVNAGMTQRDAVAMRLMHNFFQKTGKMKKELGLLEAGALSKHPFWMPRKMEDLNFAHGIQELDEIKRANPAMADKFERLINKAEKAQIDGTIDGGVNTILNKNIGPSSSIESRVFATHIESGNFVKALGGRMNMNIPELMVGELRGIEKMRLFKDLTKDLQTMWGKGLAVAPEVKDTLKQVLKLNTPEAWGAVRRAYHKWFLNPLKMSLTAPFPAFHVRNIGDNTFRAYEQLGIKSLNPIDSKAAFHIQFGGDKAIDLGNGISMNATKLQETAIGSHIMREQFSRSDITRNLNDITRQYNSAPDSIKAKLSGVYKSVMNSGEYIGTKTENHARIKAFLTGTKKYIKDNNLQVGDDLNEAYLHGIKQSKTAFFDYLEMGPIDDALAQFIPFYRFSRQNIPFQLKTLAENPHRLATLTKARNSIAQEELTEEEQKLLSPYIKENIYFSLDENETGEHLMLAGLGASVEEFNKLWSPEGLVRTMEKVSVGQAVPPVQFAYSLMSNRNPFFGSEYDDFRSRQTYKGFYENKLMRKLVGGITREPQKLKDGKVIYRYELESPKQYGAVMSILSPIASVVASKTLGGLAGGALSPRGITTAGIISDERKDADLKTLKLITGLKITEIDFNRSKLSKLYKEVGNQGIALRKEARRQKKYREMGIKIGNRDNETDFLEEEE